MTSTDRATRTPGPWKQRRDDYGDEWWFGGDGDGQYVIEGADGEFIAVYGGDGTTAHNAEFIVRAVNAHDELVGALADAIDLAVVESDTDYADLQAGVAALLRAKGDE